MPRKPPPEIHRFKKGQSGNPAGRPKGALTIIPHALKEISLPIFREVIETVLKGNMAALNAIIDDEEAPVIKIAVAKAFRKALKAGDYETVERIIERIIGKIPDELNLVSKNLNANVNLPTESAVTRDEIGAAFDEFDRDV